MKKVSNALWGIVLVVCGVIFGLNALDVTDINVFFDGWWTLFIIIPSFIGLFKTHDRTTSLIFLIIGVLLLLSCRNVFDFIFVWKLFLPIVIVIVGLKLIFSSMSSTPKLEDLKAKKKDANLKECCATFSSENVDYGEEDFEGVELNAIFGAVNCDLRNAKIKDESVISVTTIFGGAEILLPDDVNVKIKSTSIFGGVDNKAKNKKDNKKTVYIYANCLFGGVDIK